ncbi:MAG: hypothetical protein ACRC50_01085 [Gaiella sp.]
MHATFRWYPDSALADHLADHADAIRAVIGEVPGVQAYYLVRTEQGTVSVTVCDDEEGTAASSRVAAEFIRANLPDLEVAAPNISSGEVVIAR